MESSNSPILPEEYQRALDFLAANEPEQCLEVNELSAYVDYWPNKSVVIIYTAPSHIHGILSAGLQSELYLVAKNELIRHNKPELARKLKAFGESSHRPRFEVYSSRISKVPDGGLIYTLNDEDLLTLVIETGCQRNTRNCRMTPSCGWMVHIARWR
ncbi:hypothetical protein V1509DRAFT_628057 [Lipomyces kononenkoae]